jgi:hypothetical protein
MNLKYPLSDTSILPCPLEYESNGEGPGGGGSKAIHMGSSTAYVTLIVTGTHVTVGDELDSARLADQMPIVSARRHHTQTHFDLLARADKQPIIIVSHRLRDWAIRPLLGFQPITLNACPGHSCLPNRLDPKPTWHNDYLNLVSLDLLGKPCADHFVFDVNAYNRFSGRGSALGHAANSWDFGQGCPIPFYYTYNGWS